jgi:hypothetical protein
MSRLLSLQVKLAGLPLRLREIDAVCHHCFPLHPKDGLDKHGHKDLKEVRAIPYGCYRILPRVTTTTTKLQFYNQVFLPIIYTYEEQALYGTTLSELKSVIRHTNM